MTFTYASDAFNVPHLPDHAVRYTAASDGDVTYADAGKPGVSAWVVITGDVTVTPSFDAVDIVLAAVPAFTLLPFRVAAVKAATTADLVLVG